MAGTRTTRRFPWWGLLALVMVLSWAIGPWGLVPLIGFVVWKGKFTSPRWFHLAAVMVVLGLALSPWLLLRDGRLSIPQGAGWLTSSAYDGRAVSARPVKALAAAQNPHLAANGRNSMHNDAWATDAYSGPGPLGDNPTVTSAWYGILECATLAFDRAGRLIGLCGDTAGPSLHVFDPVSLRMRASLDLPERRPSKESRLQDLCGGAYFYLDQHDRAVVATTDARVATYSTTPLRGVASTKVDLPAGDCLIALMPDWAGRTWFETRHGIVGYLAKGRQHTITLEGEGIANSLASDAHGVYVVSDHAMYRLSATPSGPRIDWRREYDRGSARKVGQLSQGSGTTPTLLAGNRLAITDNADPRMNVVVLDRDDGKVLCTVPVLARGHSATENSLIGVGDWVYVENNEGYAGPWSTMLGRTTSPGIAKVDTRACRVEWTAPISAPTSVPKASLASGLIYVYEKRANRWGVNAWYLTALDLRTGQRAFRVRTGIGTLANNHYAAVTLGPDGAAYIATLSGLIRVADQG